MENKKTNNKLSLVGFIVSIVGVVFFFSSPFQVHPDLSLGITISILGGLIGLIALVQIDKNKETQKGRVYSIMSLIFPILIFMLFLLALSGIFG